jgi:hypothetical protein
MSKRIGTVAVMAFAFLIHFASLACLESKKSDEDLASVDDDKTEALEWGFKFASAIPVKPHIADRSKSQYQILEVYLERDMPDEMAESASRIADWRECLSYADLAVHFALKSRDEKVQDYINLAKECRNRLTGWKRSWQRDRILLRIAEAQVISGQFDAAEKSESELPAESASLARTLRLSRIDGPVDYENSVTKLQSMENSKHMEVQRDVARAYLQILRQMGPKATAEQCSFLQARVYGLVENLPQLLQHEILCSLSRAAFAAGRKEMGCRILEDAEKRLKLRQLKARFDVATLTELSRIWAKEGQDLQRAESILNEAKDLLLKSGLKGTDRVTALISLAEGYVDFGNRDAAWDYFRQALQTAGLQTNARPRAMAITQICAAIGRWGLPLPDDMVKEITRHYEALGNPW